MLLHLLLLLPRSNLSYRFKQKEPHHEMRLFLFVTIKHKTESFQATCKPQHTDGSTVRPS
jgi:hypothetical protein